MHGWVALFMQASFVALAACSAAGGDAHGLQAYLIMSLLAAIYGRMR